MADFWAISVPVKPHEYKQDVHWKLIAPFWNKELAESYAVRHNIHLCVFLPIENPIEEPETCPQGTHPSRQQ